MQYKRKPFEILKIYKIISLLCYSVDYLSICGGFLYSVIESIATHGKIQCVGMVCGE